MYDRTQQIQGIYVADPAKVINTTTTTDNIVIGDGMWGQSIVTDSEPYVDHINAIRSRIEKLELNNRLLKLKILQLEGTFTKEEVANIRKMLMSNDEASVTLADSIIENA
jgi:FMN-dependent NADH-azoreductase